MNCLKTENIMKRFIMILILVLPLAACRKEPDMGKTDGG